MVSHGHEIFISYSVRDRSAADAACSTLERSGLRCWMAPRDVVPGAIYGEALIEAIRASQLVVLLLSPSSNESPQVLREIERAVSRGIPVLPVRIEEVAPSSSMEYFISASQWLDAFPPPLSGHLDIVARGVKAAIAAAQHATGTLSTADEDTSKNRPQTIAAIAPTPSMSNLPPPSPYFTGRDRFLSSLRAELVARGRVVLSGLPGVGKTRAATEYAHAHRTDYHATLWVTADTRETVVSDVSALAGVLGLPAAREDDHGAAAAAVGTWLENNDGWLLLIDNADDLGLARELIPPTQGGHVIVTTRLSSSGGLGRRLIVEKLPLNESALMLLRRASLIADESDFDAAEGPDRTSAEAVAQALDGLPLALSQAAAFIEQAHISPAEYLELYEAEGAMLLAEQSSDRESVGTTFSLAFRRLADDCPAAADLVRLCAFLAPDAIPEEIFTEGAAWTSDALREATQSRLGLTRVIAEACRFSLVDRNSEAGVLGIHRVVQTVLSSGMQADERVDWLSRAVRTVSAVHPISEPDAWQRCDRLLPHVIALGQAIDAQGVDLPEAVEMLARAGAYLRQRGRQEEAEPLLEQAIAVGGRTMGAGDVRLAWALHNLAAAYQDGGRFREAEPLVRSALAIAEATEFDDPAQLGYFLSSLARLCRKTRRYDEAEQHLRRALSLAESAYGADHEQVAWSLQGLGDVYRAQHRHQEALPLLQRALALRENALDDDHPYVASALTSLADVHRSLGQYEDAESLLIRAWEIVEKVLGPEHPEAVLVLETYSRVLGKTGREDEATAMRERAKSIRERASTVKRLLTTA